MKLAQVRITMEPGERDYLQPVKVQLLVNSDTPITTAEQDKEAEQLAERIKYFLSDVFTVPRELRQPVNMIDCK